MKIKIIAMVLLMLSGSVSAELRWNKSDTIKPEEVQEAKIIYNGEINARLISELIGTIDGINSNYPATKSIKLYINSYGGSIESGYLAMASIQNSTIPIETINAGMTGSAATLLYCGAKKRYALPLATFMLHPAATMNLKNEWVRPAELALLKKDVDDGNRYFREVYKKCTSLSSEELDKILYSNDYALNLSAGMAIKNKLSQGTISGISPTPVSYYIVDDKS